MKLYIKFEILTACKKILQEQLDKLALDYVITGFNEVEIKEAISDEKMQQLEDGLRSYGIQLLENHQSVLVQKTKDAIIEMVYADDVITNSKTSAYLADKLKHSYNYISNIFSEATYTTIENFIILQKTERAKQLITNNELTFTEIAWKLNYNTVAYFSHQFKNTTGLTPTAFQRIINKKRAVSEEGK